MNPVDQPNTTSEKIDLMTDTSIPTHAIRIILTCPSMAEISSTEEDGVRRNPYLLSLNGIGKHSDCTLIVTEVPVGVRNNPYMSFILPRTDRKVPRYLMRVPSIVNFEFRVELLPWTAFTGVLEPSNSYQPSHLCLSILAISHPHRRQHLA